MAKATLSYCILKTYKGIFKKEHSGNVQVIFIPASPNFIGLMLLGKLDEPPYLYAAQQIVFGPIEYMTEIRDEMISDEKFEIIEELPCSVSSSNSGWTYNVTSSKGKHIGKKLIIEFTPEYSGGDQKIFTINGDLNLVHTENVDDKLVKMSGKVKAAKFKSIGKTNKIMGKYIGK